MTIKDGGPAFPQFPIHGETFTSDRGGMTLRDYFASQIVGHLSVSPLRQELDTSDDATYAYKLADAMLRAREVTP